MVLSIIGGPQSIAAAVYAAANSGEEIGILTPSLSADELSHLKVDGLPEDIRLQHGITSGSDHFVVISDSTSLKETLSKHRAELAGKSLLLAPGGFAGVLRVHAWFDDWGIPAPKTAEVTAFIVGGGRDAARNRFRLGAPKANLPFATETAGSTDAMLAEYVRYFPNLVASDLVTTTLSNSNHMIHPAGVLLNAARIDNAEPFLFYREGLSPGVIRLMEAVDDERMELVKALGGSALTVKEWMMRYYESSGMRGQTLLECLQGFSGLAKSGAPKTLQYRYLQDDVWFGLAQYLALARHLGTGAVHLQSVVTATAVLCPRTDAGNDEEPWQLFLDFLGKS